jgi:DNA-binding MarR family transcriptional regulator
MSNAPSVPYETTLEVRDTCLCLHLRRAVRQVARQFDMALRPSGLTSGQFSLLMALNRPQPPTIGMVAAGLAMDRTTLTADLKPLERRGLVAVGVDATDRRSRRLALTPAGAAALAAAVPAWRETEAAIERRLAGAAPHALRAGLRALAAEAAPHPDPLPAGGERETAVSARGASKRSPRRRTSPAIS